MGHTDFKTFKTWNLWSLGHQNVNPYTAVLSSSGHRLCHRRVSPLRDHIKHSHPEDLLWKVFISLLLSYWANRSMAEQWMLLRGWYLWTFFCFGKIFDMFILLLFHLTMAFPDYSLNPLQAQLSYLKPHEVTCTQRPVWILNGCFYSDTLFFSFLNTG